MNPHRPDDDLERLLADDGGELGSLYRRLPQAEPSPELDRAVLAHATRAVPAPQRRRPRWLLGIGSAAGLVLAAGIAWQVGHDTAQAPAPMNEQPAVPSYVPVQPIETPARRPPASPPPAETAVPPTAAPAAERDRPPAAVQPAPRARAAVAPTPPPPPPKAEAPPPTPVPQAARPTIVAEPATTATDAASAAADATREHLAAPPAAASGKAPSNADTTATAKRAAGVPSPTSSAELRRDMQLAPEQWLARIRQLQRQGRHQQALESLRLFRRVHPDWQVPDSLRALDP